MTRLRWRKVLRELFESKGRTALVVFSIAIGVMAFGGLLTARTVMNENLTTGYLNSRANDIAFDLSPFGQPLIHWVARQPYVTDVQGLTTYIGETVKPDGEKEDIQLTGVGDFSQLDVNILVPEAGKFPPGKDEIVLERNSLSTYNYAIGDLITVELTDQKPHQLTIVGTVHDMNTPMPITSRSVKSFVQRETLFDLGGDSTLNKLYVTIDRAALAANGENLGDYADTLSDGIEAKGVSVRSVNANLENKHWAQDNVTTMMLLLAAIGGVALAFSGFLVFNIISSFVTKQKRQIGVMKTIGASRAQIAWIFLSLVACFGLMALVIALPLSMYMAYAIATYFGSQMMNFDIDIFRPGWWVIGLEVAMALLVPMLASLVPVWQGTGMTVVEAINDGANQKSVSRFDRWLASIKLPRAWALALRNTFRHKVRLLMTLATLVMAGAFFIGVLNLYTALPNDFKRQATLESSDIKFSFSAPANKRALEVRALRGEHVAAAEGWLRSGVTLVKSDGYETERFGLYGIPENSPFTAPNLAQGRWLASVTPESRFDVVVSDEIARDYQVEVGATITLKHERETRNWQVVGIVDTREPALYGHYDTVSRWVNLRNQASEVHVRATAADAETLALVEASLSTIFTDAGLDVNDTRNAAQMLADVIATISVLIMMLLMCGVLIAVVGGLGLAGTMSLAVMERTREIGIMRSIGAGTGTLRQMLVSEGMLVGLLSLGFAWLASFPVTTVLNSALGLVLTGRPISFAVHPYAPLLWAALVLLVAVVASLLPAQNATRVSVREAIAYE
jgi:putative ABC transport system permease protein